MYIVKNHHLPLSCERYTSVTDPVRLHNTRNVGYFFFPKFRTVIRENSINVRGPQLWNALPIEIQIPSSLYSL